MDDYIVSHLSFGLQESGFVHSAFTFAYESLLGRSNIRNAEKTIPPGALISFLQKGLQYVGIEENLQREGTTGKKSKGQNESNELDQNGDIADFTLLAPKTIRALTRDRPPIQLNVPPAAAAAAIKARLEAEAKIQAGTKAAVAAGLVDVPAAQTTLVLPVPPQQSQDEQQTYSRAVNLNSDHTAAGMSQFHQSAAGLPAGASAFAAQQQRVAEAQLAALQHQEMVLRQDPSQVAAAAIAFMSTHNKVGRVARKGKSYQGLGGVQGSSSEPSSVVALHLQQLSNQSGAAEETVESVESQPHAEATGNVPMDIDDDKHAPPSSHKYTNGLEQSAVLDHNGSSTGSNTDQVISTNGQGKAERSVSSMEPRVRQDSAHTSDNALSQDSAIDEEDMKTQASPSEVLELNKHSSEVFMCAWNPVFTDLIATGSGDASARIWQMGGPDASGGCSSVRELPHGVDPNDRKNKDVTTLEWSSDGKLLATGSYDGVARVWSRTGVLVHTLSRHRGPIFSLKWNRSGNYLLSGSYDQTTIVWDVSGSSGQVVQQFNDHNAPALDVDWKDDTTFASCSTDKRVLICRVGVDHPLRIYSGHLDEVNAVKWDPSGTLLASCSDDFTAKVWNVASDKSEPLYDFTDHKAEIYTLKW
jgi:WD40 repeat protein